MLGRSNEQRRLEANAKALRKARIAKGLSRKELAKKLNVSDKAIEKIENARDNLSESRLLNILEALEISNEEFLKIKRGKNISLRVYKKNVLSNSDRRSYKKIITKEVMALKSIRISKHLSQDQASAICGYSRATIGHIENGRIELSPARIKFILECYRATYDEFEIYLKSEEQKFEIQDRCIKKLKRISDDKLKVLQTILEGF